jgi:HK97 family phage major capsid protein
MAMTIDDHREALRVVNERRKELDAEHPGEALPEEARAEFTTLKDEKTRLEALIEELEYRMAEVEEAAANPEQREAGAHFGITRTKSESDIYDLAEVRSQSNGDPERIRHGLRDNALRAIEASRFEVNGATSEQVQGNIRSLLERSENQDDSTDGLTEIDLRILQTGSPAYRRAFPKVANALVKGQHPGAGLSAEELRALNVVTTGGGYAIPFALDPTFIHVSNYSVNPYRAICRNVNITGSNTWQGVTTLGVTASRIIEGGTAADNSPSFLQPQGQVTRVHCFVPYSLEVEGDIQGLAGEITSLFTEAKDDEEALNFTTGTGTAPAPVGILGAQGLGTAAPPKVLCAGTAAFAVGDIDAAQVTLAPRWRARSSWVGNLGFYQRIRRFYTAGGETLTQMLGPGNSQGFNSVAPGGANVGYDMLGRPAYECSQINTTNVLTSGTKLGILGDWSKFIIVDRVGMNIEAVPLLMTSSLPTGNRGLYAWWRNTTVLAAPAAFVYLQTT